MVPPDIQKLLHECECWVRPSARHLTLTQGRQQVIVRINLAARSLHPSVTDVRKQMRILPGTHRPMLLPRPSACGTVPGWPRDAGVENFNDVDLVGDALEGGGPQAMGL